MGGSGGVHRGVVGLPSVAGAVSRCIFADSASWPALMPCTLILHPAGETGARVRGHATGARVAAARVAVVGPASVAGIGRELASPRYDCMPPATCSCRCCLLLLPALAALPSINKCCLSCWLALTVPRLHAGVNETRVAARQLGRAMLRAAAALVVALSQCRQRPHVRTTRMHPSRP